MKFKNAINRLQIATGETISIYSYKITFDVVTSKRTIWIVCQWAKFKFIGDSTT